MLQLRARVASEVATRTAGQQHEAAERATSGPATSLPFAEKIQKSFGRHDITGIAAFVGGSTERELDAMGADGFARGSAVALRAGAGLHTVAHEAAHVVQQRSGLLLSSDLGEAGDVHERAADQVVAGRSAESVLDRYASGGTSSQVLQKKESAKSVLSHGQHKPLLDGNYELRPKVSRGGKVVGLVDKDGNFRVSGAAAFSRRYQEKSTDARVREKTAEKMSSSSSDAAAQPPDSSGIEQSLHRAGETITISNVENR